MPEKKAAKFDDLEPRYQAIVTNAVDGIITINESGTMESVNPAALEIFGYEQDEMLGANIKMLLPEREQDEDKGATNCYVIGQHSIGRGREVIGKRKNGTIFPFLLSMSEVLLANKKTFIGIVHDISELKEVKEELVKEKELSELKSRFVTMASHEFRTPLSAILSSISLIARYNENDDTDKRLKHVGRIKSSVDNLTTILNGFLSLSKLEEGVTVVDAVAFDIRDLTEEVSDELNGILKNRQQIVSKHTSDTQTVYLDKSLLRNIMLNLVSNAIKYSKEGKKIQITTTIENNQLTLIIQDEGIGIPAYEQKYIFSRFFRAQNATSISGTGLGLNIVKKYLDLMNGTITFTSNHEGTTFTVQIPL
ncbi:PAS domain-containing sensor histidine kinase [Cytophaga aurantiaca]|uniref:PAS domain-containing sensor histidine kinase n=1 Tax=Cytophaga aurantiaca TaxID=29530 RepID=UPI00036DB247|nr:PAS domain-containing sensor histidine kinase [Cytophaga aurantiaca]